MFTFSKKKIQPTCVKTELLDLRNVQVNNGQYSTNAATPIKRRLSETDSISLSELLNLHNVQANNRQYSTNAATPTKRRLSETNSISPSTSKQVCKEFTEEDDHVVVYVDGACENNGHFNAKAGIGVWFGHNHRLNISEPVKGRATNNTAEIQACIKAVEIALRNGIRKLKIKSDSEFIMNSMTQWIYKWRTNNWKNANGDDLKNQEDFMILDNVINGMEHVAWEYVEGHADSNGNEVDKLAKAGALLYKII